MEETQREMGINFDPNAPTDEPVDLEKQARSANPNPNPSPDPDPELTLSLSLTDATHRRWTSK